MSDHGILFTLPRSGAPTADHERLREAGFEPVIAVYSGSAYGGWVMYLADSSPSGLQVTMQFIVDDFPEFKFAAVDEDGNLIALSSGARYVPVNKEIN